MSRRRVCSILVLMLPVVVAAPIAAGQVSAGRERNSILAGSSPAVTPPGRISPLLPIPAWRQLDLPHDWSIEGPVAESNPSGFRDGFFPTGHWLVPQALHA